MSRTVLHARFAPLLVFVACNSSSSCSYSCSSPSSPAPSAGSPTGPASASASGAVDSAAPASASAGPVVSIPAGKLVAGTACGDQPRLPSDEPAGISVDLGAFSIDAYPYPNDPSKPALTGVTQAEARTLCAARGRRLCTELEWERACKGPSNTRYEYGNRFDAKKCSTALGTVANAGPTGALASCKSEFGVFAMHGFVFEWTASAWGRGKEGNAVALRGGFGNQPFAHLRCSAAKESAPDAKDASVGFRCCGGPENAAKVDLPKDESAVLEPVEAPPPELVGRLQSALKHGGVTQGAVDKVWRWHPVPNEELFIARLVDKKGDKAATLPVVILLCERIAQLTNKLRGWVDEMSDPVAKSEPIQGGGPNDQRSLVVFTVKSGTNTGDVRFEYQFGQVAITQPSWLQ